VKQWKFLMHDHLKKQHVPDIFALISNHGQITLFCQSYHIQPWSDNIILSKLPHPTMVR
jgi:hypothetical protein